MNAEQIEYSRERERIERQRVRARRCGICQEAINGQSTRMVDDERCHADCAELHAQGEL